MSTLRNAIRWLRRYRSATAGIIIILALVIVSIVTVITIPLSEAIGLWKGAGGVWFETPRTAAPSWVNLFPGVNLPANIIVDSREVGTKSVRYVGYGISEFEILLPFYFEYDCFPQEITVFFEAVYDRLRPAMSLTWITPDGREISLGMREGGLAYRMSLDKHLWRKLEGLGLSRSPHVALFQQYPVVEKPVPLRGRYELRVEGMMFEADADLDVRLVIYGQVYGLAGTDHMRRDIMVALLWGAPIALVFGTLGAVGASLSTFILAAIGVWYGKWLDATFRWLTQTNMLLPGFAILVLIATLYTRALWVILSVIILLSVFSGSLFVLRSIFLQVKEQSYIEAARAYGAGNFRIIFRYMIPKVIPVLVPGLITMIPGFVFMEAGLAMLGLGDPFLPTWGKVLSDSFAHGAMFLGNYHWVLLPSALLITTGVGFALLGFTLDRIFNPRLRER